jgi:hypothetical protein
MIFLDNKGAFSTNRAGVVIGASLAMFFGVTGWVLAAGPLDVIADNETTVVSGDNETGVVCDDSSIRLDLEEPKEGVVASGVANLRGWAVATSGIASVELYIDGEHKFAIPSGGKRGDVSRAYPESEYPGSINSGFSMAYNYNNLDGEVPHEFKIRAVAEDGGCLEKSVTTSVARFENPWYGANVEMDLSEAEAEIVDNQLVIFGAQLGDTAYDIAMGWHKAGQKLSIDNVTAYGLDELYGVTGDWNVEFTFYNDVGMEGDVVVCTDGGFLNTVMPVVHEGSVVTIGSTPFTYVGNNPLFGMMFEGQQEESLHGGTRITDWDLNMRSDKVTGIGIWEWSDGISTCQGTTDVVGTKVN